MIERLKILFKYLFRGVLRRKEGRKKDLRPVPTEATPEKLRLLTCLKDKGDDDPLVAAIRRDMEGKSSVLELMKSYL